jgi:hypothetical protein
MEPRMRWILTFEEGHCAGSMSHMIGGLNLLTGERNLGNAANALCVPASRCGQC